MGPTFETVLEFMTFLFISIVYAFYIFLQGLVTVINSGINIFVNSKSQLSGKDAQYGRILWKRKISTFQTSSAMDFLCVYLSRVEPDYVLRPNVSLYCVSKHEAIFVENPENINIYKSDENPFLYLAQYNRGTNIIKMAMETFHSISEMVGDPLVPVIWLSNTGRCGSTMLCQIFETVPGTLVLSEPDAALKVCDLQSLNKVSKREFDDIVRSTVRILCKPRPNTDRIFVKTRSACASLMTPLSNLFPKRVIQMFMYRNCLDTTASWGPSMGVTPYGKIVRACADNELISSVVPFFRKQFRFEIQCKLNESKDIPLANTYEMIIHMWANFMILARDAMSRDKSILAIEYEDIVSNPQEVIKTIFIRHGIDLKYMERAIHSLERDSQRGSAISGRRLRKDPRRHISDENRQIADAILSSYNLPRMGETFAL